MSFQTRKTFVHLRNRNEDIFDEIRELSDLPTIFCNSPAVVFSHSKSPPHRALGWYRHMSSSRLIHNMLRWLGIPKYCPDGGNANFHCCSSFLKATSLICEAQLSFAAHQKYILWFFSMWWMIKGIWALFSLLFFISVKQEAWLDNFMFKITLECSKLWIWTRLYFRDILLIRISRGANNCVQCVFKKNIYFIMRFPPILNYYYPMKG